MVSMVIEWLLMGVCFNIVLAVGSRVINEIVYVKGFDFFGGSDCVSL